MDIFTNPSRAGCIEIRLSEFNDHRGLDHGAWIPLLHLLPKADVPVFQVSMPFNLNTQQAVKLGQALALLRNQGVLIVASGGITHNLNEFRPSVKTPEVYVQEFVNWVRAKVLANEINSLIQYRTKAPHAERAHPSEEHFLPLLIGMGVQDDDGTAQLLDGEITNGVLSMDSYIWGMPHHADNRRGKDVVSNKFPIWPSELGCNARRKSLMWPCHISDL